MGRALRHDSEGAWHHLMNRGADRQDILSTEDDYAIFEHHLGDLYQRGLFEPHAYALMGNHFHVLGRSPIGALSEAMHRLGSEYARWYNRRHRRDGPLFRNRFVSVPIDGNDHFVIAARYVHRNPKAIVPVPALGAYRWSSYGAHLGRRPAPPWLALNLLGELMGSAEQHRQFVEQPHSSDDDHDRWRPFLDGVDAVDIEQVVNSVIGSPVELRSGRGHPRSDGLALLLMLAVEFRVETAAQLADRYGLAGASAVRTAARRARVRLADDPAFASLRKAALRALDTPSTAA